MAAPKVGFFPDPKFQLLAYLRRCGVDPHGLEPAKVFVPQFGVDDMQRPLVAIEALLDEGQQDGIELIRVAEERADMTVALQWRPGESNLSQYLCHRPLLAAILPRATALVHSQHSGPISGNRQLLCLGHILVGRARSGRRPLAERPLELAITRTRRSRRAVLDTWSGRGRRRSRRRCRQTVAGARTPERLHRRAART